MNKDFREAVEKIYSYRKNNIILGLTGRTGSGCSTVARILKTATFEELDLMEDNGSTNKESLQRSVIHGFLSANKRWRPFHIIEVSNLILSFVLEKGKEAFINYISNIEKSNDEQKRLTIGSIKDFKNILEKLDDYYTDIQKYKLDSIDNLSKEQSQEFIDFYLDKLSDFKTSFKQELRIINCSIVQRLPKNGIKKSSLDFYTFLMQKFGNNLRATGDCFDDSIGNSFNTTIMERIDKIISLIYHQEESFSLNDTSLRICINSLRNPIEIIYLKDRYSCFYQLSVNVDEKERCQRLSLHEDELLNLDRVEYPQKYECAQQIFYHQNIQKCIEFASIHINNKNFINGKYTNLTEQLIRYIALMIHPGLITPTKEESCMQIAFNAKMNSGCLSRQVGSVITSDDWSIKAVGWNDVPAKQLPCSLRTIPDYCSYKNEHKYSEFEISDSKFETALRTIRSKFSDHDLNGMPYCYCFKDVYNGLEKNKNQVHTRSLHAEENAFLQISKYGGQGIQNGKLFVTASPCELCSKKSYQLGIRHIYYIDPYPGIARSHILKFGTDETCNPEVHLFQGAVGDAYVSLYSQRLSIKDELAYITGIDNKQVVEEIESPKYRELKCTDIVFESVEVNFVFKSRTQIKCVTTHKLIPKIKGIKDLEFISYWTGSSFDNITCKEYNILPESATGNKTIHKYRIDFGNELQVNKVYTYTIQTNLRDVDMTMAPYISRRVQHETKKLDIIMSYGKDANFIKQGSIKSKVYADKEMSQKLEERTMKCPKGDIKQYRFSPKKPNVNYCYSIEWEFVENT